MTQPAKTKFFLSVLATSAILVAGMETLRPQQVLAKAMGMETEMPAAFALASGDIDALRKKAEDFVCGDKRVQLRSRIINAVDYIVDPVDEQVTLLDDVRAKTVENDQIIATACASYKALGEDLPSMMEKRRLALSTALQLMDNVQPSVKAFYESLNEEQLERLRAVLPPQIAKRL
ncbi:MAG: hypothetical protein KDI90_04000 [Alphaproteobacteria bacterium]|nr:hypothetical protein [Alphaproteobacteria bacterium]MCB9975905.1 hypothetical protein [Rhodospirillales bacterium]